MSFLKSDIQRNGYMLDGLLGDEGYDWWWHSFTGKSRKTGKECTFFIEFFLCNPELAEDKPVFGQAQGISGKKPSYLMVKAGWWGENAKQLHRYYSFKDTRIKRNVPFEISAGNCMISETMTRGRIEVSPENARLHPEWMSDAGSMRWALTIEKTMPYNVGFGASSLFRKLTAFDMFWHVEGMKTFYSGEVVANGEIFDIVPETCYGYADKNWGCDFTSPWVWLSSSDLYSVKNNKKLNNSAFTVGGGRPVAFGFPLRRKLLGGFCYEGRPIDFNFSKPWLFSGSKFKFKEKRYDVRWKVLLENREYVLKVAAACPKNEMMLVRYEAPDGAKRHNRLWNGGTGKAKLYLYRKTAYGLALIDEIEARHVGCEYGEY